MAKAEDDNYNDEVDDKDKEQEKCEDDGINDWEFNFPKDNNEFSLESMHSETLQT